ncbi:acyloxyacyl hydrolase [Verrucomicrobiaceae bacterium R5-34]|nr:acyloxyacyl hydrolase [Verrucomicrobiaceae bacterium R5-34]
MKTISNFISPSRLLPAIFSIALIPAVHAQSIEKNSHFFDTVGMHGGTDAESDISIENYEVFATVSTHHVWKLGEQTKLTLKFEGAVGALINEDDTAIYARIGPQLVLSSDALPLSLVASSGPAYLTDHTFENLDLGGGFQFISSIGFDWEINDHWSLGYRWNHISNAGIHDENPGLNLHTIGFSYQF